jgi:uncharacterized nucleotidyltransferase DUF6036
MFSQDFKELLSALNEHRVKYLIVGGYAVAIHAQPRATKDLDIFIEPSAENAKNVFAALTKFGAPLGDLRPEDFTDPNIFFRMGTPPQMVEILPRISGVEFEQAWEHRLEAVIDNQTGLKAFVISADDLIANKTAFGRPYDVADADAVRTAQRLRGLKKKPPEPTGPDG